MTLFAPNSGDPQPPEPGRAAASDPVEDRPPPVDPDTAMVRVRMTLAYDGSGFRGFSPNVGVRTVGETLRKAIEQVQGHTVAIVCGGRTDSGVHAQGQVISFDARRDGLDLNGLQQSLNSMCGPEIVVREAAEAADGFDARRSATARCYRYTILNRRVPDPFLAATTWHIPTPLDLRAMRTARDPFIGEHDFSSFCRRPKQQSGVSLRRRIVDAAWHDVGDDLLRFDIEANAFCHQMVRAVVGLLVDVGLGKVRAGEVTSILRARDRQVASDLAAPHGLTLWQVRYD